MAKEKHSDTIHTINCAVEMSFIYKIIIEYSH